MPRDLSVLMDEVRALAVEYYAVTGKPLGVTGEIAEIEAARLMGLTLAEARSPGYDATRATPIGIERIQIKGRWKRDGTNWGRVGAIDLEQPFDTVFLVLMEGTYQTKEIWSAPRAVVADALRRPGSKARNERGSLAVSKFKTLGIRVWPPVPAV